MPCLTFCMRISCSRRACLVITGTNKQVDRQTYLDLDSDLIFIHRSDRLTDITSTKCRLSLGLITLYRSG